MWEQLFEEQSVARFALLHIHIALVCPGMRRLWGEGKEGPNSSAKGSPSPKELSRRHGSGLAGETGEQVGRPWREIGSA